MSIFGALRTAEQGMNVHRFRTQIAAENLSNAYSDPNYQRKVVRLGDGTGVTSMRTGGMGSGALQSIDGVSDGAVRVLGVARQDGNRSERAKAMLDVQEMMHSQAAFQLQVRVASMVRSMAMSSLEIGRGM